MCLIGKESGLRYISPNCKMQRFSTYIQERDEMELRPVFTIEGITFVYIKVMHIGIY
jgi:hypothetical protein